MAIDVYAEVTNKIVSMLEVGVVPWRSPILGQKEAGWPKNLDSRKTADSCPRMNPNTFREITSDPEAWRTKARTLRSAAQALWHSSLGLITESGVPLDTQEQRSRATELFAERLHTSQLLYGLAVETALKARIIALDAANIRFVEKKDPQGVIVDVKLQRIGADLAGDGHDLMKLADVAGVVGPAATAAVFTIESDKVAIQEILAFLTDCVRWSGRYPAPKSANGYYWPTHKIPARILGHYMRDWLDPFLDALLPDAAGSKPPAPDAGENRPIP